MDAQQTLIRRRARLSVEALEDRTAPASFVAPVDPTLATNILASIREQGQFGVPTGGVFSPGSVNFINTASIDSTISSAGPYGVHAPISTANVSTPAAPQHSTVRLFEQWSNGNILELGEANSPLADICAYGQGRFVVWQGLADVTATLYFSSSDATSPRNNGRGYFYVTSATSLDPSTALATTAICPLTIDFNTTICVGGNAYVAFAGIPADGDTITNSDVSRLRLFEVWMSTSTVVELTGAHALHDAIRASGSGLFSHWQAAAGTELVMSSSDNTDPRLNNRVYVAVYPIAQDANWVGSLVNAANTVQTSILMSSNPERFVIELANSTGNTISNIQININGTLFYRSIQEINADIYYMMPAYDGEPMYRKIFRYVVTNYSFENLLSVDRWQHEPLLALNSIGYGICDDSATLFYFLATAFGYEARVIQLKDHLVPEVFNTTSGRWEMYDTAFGIYFTMADGVVASVNDLVANPALLQRPTVVNEARNGQHPAYTATYASFFQMAREEPWYYFSPTVAQAPTFSIPAGGKITIGYQGVPPPIVPGGQLIISPTLTYTIPATSTFTLTPYLALAGFRGMGQATINGVTYTIGSAQLNSLVATNAQFYPTITVVASATAPAIVDYWINANRFDLGEPGSVSLDCVTVSTPTGGMTGAGNIQIKLAPSGINPPVINVIANQIVTQATLNVPFTASDPDGDPVTVNARALSLHQFKQELGLSYTGNYYVNSYGINEKWLQGSDQLWYCILPNGEVRHIAGDAASTMQAAALVVTLDSSYYVDPSRLWNAPAGTLPVNVTLVGNQLTVDPASNYAGTFVIKVTATSRSQTTDRYFTVTVSATAPELAAIADQNMRAGQHQLTVSLTATGAVTFSARGLSAGYVLGRSLGLYYAGSYYLNAWGMREKWFTNSANEWYCILPNGEVRKFAGSAAATLQASALVASLDSSYFANPSQLWNAHAQADYQQAQGVGLHDAGSYYLNTWGMNEKWALGDDQQYYCVLPNGELRRWAGTTSATLNPAALVATLSTSCYDDPSQLWNAPAPVAGVSVAGNRLTVSPPVGFAGTLLVEVAASNGLAASKRTFNLTVTNSAPVLMDIPDQTMTAGQGQLVVPLTASDEDGDDVTFSARSLTAGFVLGQSLGLHYVGNYYLNAWGMNEKWCTSAANEWYCILPNGELRKFAGTAAATLQASALVAKLDSSYFTNPNQFWNPNTLADYQQGQLHGLHDAGSYYLNAWGMNEKWTLGNNQQWYCVLPNGQLRHWAGTTTATLQPAALVASLNTSCYDDPSQLWNAPAPVAAVSVVGTQLTVAPPLGFVGTLYIEVRASDGIGASTSTFKLTVTSIPPVQSTIANQTMAIGQTRHIVTQSASDADGDPLTFSAPPEQAETALAAVTKIHYA